MKKLALTEEFHIRPVVKAVGFFIATMLIQVGTYNIGTIVASCGILAIILSSLYEKKNKVSITITFSCLVLFALFTFLNTIISSNFSNILLRLLVQVLACCMLLNIQKLNYKEEKFLKNIFLYSVVVYGLLILKTSFFGTNEYRQIILLGTDFDPNFIGIPFVVTSVLALHGILSSNKNTIQKIFQSSIYILCCTVIMFTASRGNLLGLAISNATFLYFFLFTKKTHFYKKIFLIIISLLALLYVFITFQLLFPKAMLRMLTLGEAGSDSGRFILWIQAFWFWTDNPIFGGGILSNYLTFRMATHNTYLQLLSETGLLGTVLFIPFLWESITKTFRYNKLYFSILLGMLVQITFLDALDNRVVWSILFWFTLLPYSDNNKKETNRE